MDNFETIGVKKTSHRQQRMAEEIRKVLSQMFMREELYSSDFSLSTVTVTYVDVSPDLKNAKIYVMPLGGLKQNETLAFLKENVGQVRHYLSKNLIARHTPTITFAIDNIFDKNDKINELFLKI